MNGEIALNKWREGGYHLVLMDIQLPVMNGLDATKEIRRLERVNNIGVFSSSPASSSTSNFGTEAKDALNGNSAGETAGADESQEPKAEDYLINTALFKSPVIIVALTASSLQSDRHEALAAGCNDFLTKVRSRPLLRAFHMLTFPFALARQLRLALPQSNGMGLHASSH